MASVEAQQKWRQKNRMVKSQLNIMARRLVHDSLDDIAELHGFRGKGEAASFAVYVTRALLQQAEFNEEAARLCEMFRAGYDRDRDAYAP
jgi:hypothetical protein